MAKKARELKAKSGRNVKPLPERPEPQKKVESQPRSGSKQEKVLGLLRRSEGASDAFAIHYNSRHTRLESDAGVLAR